MPSWRKRDVLAGVLVLVATPALLLVPPAYGFVGWDTYPILAAARIESLADLRGTFTEWLAHGYFPFGFYRPAYNLSMAGDYALWGLQPFGFRLTNALLWGGCAFALYRLTATLLGSRALVGPLCGLLAFLVLPVHGEVAAGPFGRRSDLLCGLFVVLALLSQLRRLDSNRPSRHLVPVLWTILAQASKETAVVMPALVFVLAMVAGQPRPAAERLRRALGTAAWHALGVLVVVMPRALVVGGIAGHAGTSLDALAGRFPATLGQVVLGLVAGQPALRTPTFADTLVGCGVGVTSLVVLIARLRQADRRTPLLPVTSASLVGLATIGAFAGVYAMVGWVTEWYLLLPSLGLTIVIAAVAESAALAARAHVRWRVASGAMFAVLAAWTAWQGAASPFFSPPGWSEWTQRSDAFFGELQARLERSPDGAVVRTPYPARIVRPYTVQAWADIVFGADQVRIVSDERRPLPLRAGITVVLLQ